VTHLFKDHIPAIREHGEVEVSLSGRPFRIKREFLDDVAEHRLLDTVAKLHKALLILHAPTDDYVSIDNATKIFIAAKHPKSFISLASADHLLAKKQDAFYVADMIAAWAARYLDMPAVADAPSPDAIPDGVVVRETGAGKLQQEILVGKHRLLADEPVKEGGLDSGPGPYDFLRRAEIDSVGAHHRDAEAQPNLCQGLRNLRDERGHGQLHRSDNYDGRRSQRRAAQEAARNRRQMPGPSHADIGDRYRHARRRVEHDLEKCAAVFRKDYALTIT
jgi:hypothetical protein